MDREELTNLNLTRLHQAIKVLAAGVIRGPDTITGYGPEHPVALVVAVCRELARQRAEQFGREIGEACGIMWAFRIGAAYARQGETDHARIRR